MKERTYMVLLDDGHNYFEFRFTSTHRRGTKLNQEDCMIQLAKKYGHKKVLSIYWERFNPQLDNRDF